MARLGFPLAISLAALAVACGDECHPIACGSGLIVELAPSSGAFDDGAYQVDLASPQGNDRCSFVVAGGKTSAEQCSPAVASLDSSELPRYMLVRYPGDYVVDSISVTLSRDGTALGAEDFAPEYQDVSVDSQACGGPCNAAQVSLGF